MPCSPLKVNQYFGRTHRLHLQIEEKAMQESSRKQVATSALAIHATCFTLPSSLAYSLILKMEATSSSKCQLTFNELHGVISQKTELFRSKEDFFSPRLLYEH
jgi:hypothetical protein